MNENTGIYVHIPFCASKCDYCSFYSVVPDSSELTSRYVDALLREIDHYAVRFPSLSVDTVYFGGGTPGMIGGENFKKIISHLYSAFDLSSLKESTVETNPFSTPDIFYLSALEAGITRLTAGVQSMSEVPARFLGRKKGDDARLREIYSLPFLHRCADYIVGIPGQSEDEVRREIEFLASLQINHISAYLLTVDEGTPLAVRFTPDDAFDDMQVRLYSEAMKVLSLLDFEHYEISNFARNAEYSLHNCKYWEYAPYLGLGAGAHSFLQNQRWSNPLDVERYCAGEVQIIADVRRESDAMAEFMMMGLRLRSGVSLDRFKQIFGREIPTDVMSVIEKERKAGHLFVDDNRLRINWDKYFISDEIIGAVSRAFL